ncbi:UNVERIFIED_CONTAM: chitin deacetylase [Siphonaria sp. JEL0065]|nr:chitin deacetylase [Siphonaria sp. JEL0065]
MHSLLAIAFLAISINAVPYDFSKYPPINQVGPAPKLGWIQKYLQNVTIPTTPVKAVPVVHPDWTADITTCNNASSWAITYDDGPGPYTSSLLDHLKSVNVKVTFFIVGSRIREGKMQAEALLKAYQAGHQIAIQPPGGDIDDRTRAVIQAVGLKIVDSNDWFFSTEPPQKNYTEAQELQKFKNWTKNPTIAGTTQMGNTRGIISIQHDLFTRSVKMAAPTLQLVMKAGYKVMPVGQCIADASANWYTGFNDSYPNVFYAAPVTTSLAPSATFVNTSIGSGDLGEGMNGNYSGGTIAVVTGSDVGSGGLSTRLALGLVAVLLSVVFGSL